MNREIKFRFYDDINKIFKYIILQSDTGVDISDWIIQYNPLQQYTGLKDKNGNEVYEGDIFFHKFRFETKYTSGNFPVIFKNGCFGFEIFTDPKGGIHNASEDIYEFRILRNWIPNITKIGNNYENPELLE